MGRRKARTGHTSCVCSFTPSPGVRVLLASLTCAFASGAIGGVLHFGVALLVHLAQIHGLDQLPVESSLGALYQSVVLGGLWGLLLIFRVGNVRQLGLQALAYSLVPTSVTLLYVYPHFTPWGYLGLKLSPLVPLYEFLINYLAWSLPALAWFSMLGHEDGEDPDDSLQPAYSPTSILSTAGPSLSNPMLV